MRLETFEILDDPSNNVLITAQQARSALENDMKALPPAHRMTGGTRRRLNRLTGIIKRIYPELTEFHLSIPPEAYAGDQPELTGCPGYRERTANEVR